MLILAGYFGELLLGPCFGWTLEQGIAATFFFFFVFFFLLGEETEQFLLQPKSSKDFAFVTILWSDDFVDNTIVWATSLMATGSTFRRICLIGRGRIRKSRITILSRHGVKKLKSGVQKDIGKE